MTSIQLLYLLGSPPAFVFPFYYHFTARWWRLREGRLFMAMVLIPFSLYLSVVLFLLVPEGLIKDVIRFFLVTLASGVSWLTLWTYRQIRREEMQRLGSGSRWMKQTRTDEARGGESVENDV